MTFDADLEYSDSIYSPEEYDKLTEGKFGKEIFVLHNSNDSDDNNSIIIDEPELRSKIHCNDFSEYVIKAVKKTVKCEDALIRQILYTGFSSYIEDDPINLGIIAPTSEGKTYPVEETMKFFPRSDVYKIGSMSTKALVREKGILVDKCNEPLEERLKELREQKNTAKNKEEKEQTSDQIKELYEDAKTLIDLRGKILVFLEPPDKEVWDILKPILSHDSFEIEFPFVDKNERDGLYTKKVVVKGWPSCIFCSAKDESKWEIWPEVQSRFLISSPNMVPQKYRESTKLIASRKGLPNLIQQQTIISDTEIELAKQCVLLIKQKIKELKTKNKDNKISIWIPYNQLLERELPANKGTDVRIQKRIFSLLNIVPIVKFNLRKLLVLGDETSIIADLDDLKEVLSISHNFEGIPKYKIEFFNNIFYPLYKSKTESDSNADASKKEDRKAVTARQLCDFYKEKIGKIINTDRLKKTYLDELANNGLIDLEISKIHAQQYIYYPIVEPLSCYNNSINDNDESSSSFSSKVEQFDQVSQYSFTIYKKIIKNITEQWLFYEIIRLLSHRIDVSNIRGQLADHLNKYEEFQLLDNSYESNLENTNKDIEAKKEIEEPSFNNKNQCTCYNKEHRNGRLTIRQFTQQYVTFQFDGKISTNITLFDKISSFSSKLQKFDDKDETKYLKADIEDSSKSKESITLINDQINPVVTTLLQEAKENYEQQQQKLCKEQLRKENSSLFFCVYCNFSNNNENEIVKHSINTHPGKPARPNTSLIELLKQTEVKSTE